MGKLIIRGGGFSPTGNPDSTLIARIEALEARTDSDTVYDDTALIARIAALEARTDSDTIYDDTTLANRVTALENSTPVLSNDILYIDGGQSNL